MRYNICILLAEIRLFEEICSHVSGDRISLAHKPSNELRAWSVNLLSVRDAGSTLGLGGQKFGGG